MHSELSVGAQSVPMCNSSMKLHPVCQLAVLSLCCVLITGQDPEKSIETLIPGLTGCRCPETLHSVRGQLKEFRLIPIGPDCNVNTIIVVLKRSNVEVCLDPKSRMGRLLIRCFNKATEMGRDVKLCLNRRIHH